MKIDPHFYYENIKKSADSESMAELIADLKSNPPKRKFESLSGFDWQWLLIKHPEFGSECDKAKGWQKISTNGSWLCLLNCRPQFVEKFEAYTDLNEFKYGWGNLLWLFPQYANKCDELDMWETINEEGDISNGDMWAILLADRPEFSDKCDNVNGWRMFDEWSWSYLLSKQPQFSNKCNEENFWQYFENEEWVELLSMQPQFITKFKVYSKNFRSTLSNTDWNEILKFQPSLKSFAIENGYNKNENVE